MTVREERDWMAQSPRTGNLELRIGATNPKRVLQSSCKKYDLAVRGQIPGDDKHFYVFGHVKTRNCPERCLW